ncbi:MAG: rRNA maturation RNase YbeY [Betaproteobacteria bacterium]|nr:rRNA maturation RNase YbeY [Betaproteobacteria bacterium]
MGKPTHNLSLSVQYACEDAVLPSRSQLRRWVSAALSCDAVVTIRFVDAVEGRLLNGRYRGKDLPTNVLSFPYEPPPRLAGDLVLCVPTVMQEARRQEKTAQSHFAHLVVHGMLHLQGYAHEADAEAALMETRESEILARLGVANPY